MGPMARGPTTRGLSASTRFISTGDGRSFMPAGSGAAGCGAGANTAGGRLGPGGTPVASIRSSVSPLACPAASILESLDLMQPMIFVNANIAATNMMKIARSRFGSPIFFSRACRAQHLTFRLWLQTSIPSRRISSAVAGRASLSSGASYHPGSRFRARASSLISRRTFSTLTMPPIGMKP